MTPDEEAVVAATRRFYAAIEDMITGKGLEAMHEAWHHLPTVSSGHPTGDWAHGWDEVAATWEVFASYGDPKNSGSQIRDIRPRVHGDFAYTTSVFTASKTFGGAVMSCTNVLARIGGVWKIVHHHADKAPSVQSSLEKMASGG